MKIGKATEEVLGRPPPRDHSQNDPPSLRSRGARPIREEIYRRYLKGEDAQTLASEFGVRRQTIYNVVSYLAKKRGRTPPRRLTPEEHEDICKLYRDGYSTKFIAERFARTPKTILEILSRGGVEVERGFWARSRKAG